MAVDFPSSPTVGQTFTSGAQSWTWDGAKWIASGVYVGPPQFSNTNRIINGDMRIDQRNNGASGTGTGVYTVDRWLYGATQVAKGTWQRSASGPVLVGFGFPYYLGFQASSAYALLAGDLFNFQQRIEADMVGDFAWGTAGAQPVTLSFFANSSLAGTFGGAVNNAVPGTRSYPFSFPLTANTWTKIVISIPGDTAGTWTLQGNGIGAAVWFGLGVGSTFSAPAGAWVTGDFRSANGAVSVVGTNGAAFNITGVKLEIGSIATPFNRKSPQESLADCQRYYCARSSHNIGGAGFTSAITINWPYNFPVNMRSAPTMTINVAGGSGYTSPISQSMAPDGFVISMTSSGTAYVAGVNWQASAEL